MRQSGPESSPSAGSAGSAPGVSATSAGFGAALVTGGARGIGAAVVRRLVGWGTKVAVLDRDPGDEGPGTFSLACDVADESQVVEGVRRSVEAVGGLDLAVLNAGIGGFSPLLDMGADEWDRVLAVNLRGVFLSLREVARHLVERGRGGSVVVTSSTSGTTVEPGMSHYNVSKAGVNQLVRAAARELGPHGIRVNAVAPGATDTPLLAPTRQLPGFWDRVARRTPLGGIGDPDAVAEALLAVAGLGWVTGQVLAADGGTVLWSPIDPTEGTGLA